MNNPNPAATREDDDASTRARAQQSVPVGSIVQYRESEHGAPRAAIVVADAGGGKANLHVFNAAGEGTTFVRGAEQGKGVRQWSGGGR